MKNKLFAALLISILISCPVSAQSFYKVLKVLDGDTFYIDLNSNGKIESGERVRVNGVDAFEVKLNAALQRQANLIGISDEDALKLGYLGKEFAKKSLFHKKVKVEYTANQQTDHYNRGIVSIYYDCDKNGYCKSYEQEVLKSGYALVYKPSNISKNLWQYQNIEKIRENIQNAQDLELVVLNKRSGRYHTLNCEYGWMSKRFGLIEKPRINFRKHPASCCHNVKPHHKEHTKNYKTYNKVVQADVQENNIELFFLNPIEQKKPTNKCVSDACKALLYNIDHAQESIDFAIYGIRRQDAIFEALIQAQKRGVKVRWVTDTNEKELNIYSDTYKLMKKLPTYNTDFESQQMEIDTITKYKIPHKAIMHDKFFIFDKKIVFTGSTNISDTCLTGYNSNVAVLIDNPQVAEVFAQEFEQMFSGKFHNQKSAVKNNENIKVDDAIISIYFSPLNKASTEQIIPLIKTAKKSIYVPVYYMTRNDIIDELISAKKRGLDVKIIVDETAVNGQYVDIDYIKNGGVELKVEHWKGMMHMKSMIIDDSTLIIGSMNFTKQGENVNDENCLIIKNAPILTSAYKVHFLDLWKSIR